MLTTCTIYADKATDRFTGAYFSLRGCVKLVPADKGSQEVGYQKPHGEKYALLSSYYVITHQALILVIKPGPTLKDEITSLKKYPILKCQLYETAAAPAVHI